MLEKLKNRNIWKKIAYDITFIRASLLGENIINNFGQYIDEYKKELIGKDLSNKEDMLFFLAIIFQHKESTALLVEKFSKELVGREVYQKIIHHFDMRYSLYMGRDISEDDKRLARAIYKIGVNLGLEMLFTEKLSKNNLGSYGGSWLDALKENIEVEDIDSKEVEAWLNDIKKNSMQVKVNYKEVFKKIINKDINVNYLSKNNIESGLSYAESVDKLRIFVKICFEFNDSISKEERVGLGNVINDDLLLSLCLSKQSDSDDIKGAMYLKPTIAIDMLRLLRSFNSIADSSYTLEKVVQSIYQIMEVKYGEQKKEWLKKDELNDLLDMLEEFSDVKELTSNDLMDRARFMLISCLNEDQYVAHIKENIKDDDFLCKAILIKGYPGYFTKLTDYMVPIMMDRLMEHQDLVQAQLEGLVKRVGEIIKENMEVQVDSGESRELSKLFKITDLLVKENRVMRKMFATVFDHVSDDCYENNNSYKTKERKNEVFNQLCKSLTFINSCTTKDRLIWLADKKVGNRLVWTKALSTNWERNTAHILEEVVRYSDEDFNEVYVENKKIKNRIDNAVDIIESKEWRSRLDKRVLELKVNSKNRVKQIVKIKI